MMMMTMTGLCRLCILLMHLFGKLLVRPWPDQPDRVLRRDSGRHQTSRINGQWLSINNIKFARWQHPTVGRMLMIDVPGTTLIGLIY